MRYKFKTDKSLIGLPYKLELKPDIRESVSDCEQWCLGSWSTLEAILKSFLSFETNSKLCLPFARAKLELK